MYLEQNVNLLYILYIVITTKNDTYHTYKLALYLLFSFKIAAPDTLIIQLIYMSTQIL